MHETTRKIIVGSLLLILAIAIVSFLVLSATELGRLKLIYRVLMVDVAIIFAIVGIYQFLSSPSANAKYYLLLIAFPLLIGTAYYYFGYLQARSGDSISGRQLASARITENTSNGIIEVGFAYPIYTPTISISNNALYTRDVNVFLRILDGNNDPALFRAVRVELPDARLSVEATVNGLLSERSGYLFIPIALPPLSEVVGRVVFIISNLNDGSTFDEALGRSYPAEFEIREPESGELLASFPMTRI